jgi:hypothetical protein
VLSDSQIQSTVAVEIGHRAAALLAVNGNPRCPGAQRVKSSMAISQQNEADSGVATGGFLVHAEEILR